MPKSKSKFAIRYALEEFAAEVARLYDAVLWSSAGRRGPGPGGRALLTGGRQDPQLRQALTVLGVLEP